PGIRRFIWEHALNVNRILHRLKCAGATVTTKKLLLCRPTGEIVGQLCSYEGRQPLPHRVDAIRDWEPPVTLKDVRSFLGLCG
ncbi:hypothetical protein SISNIDRAFT_387055, partial [Sistotremastrum niveocremeum HHB9708]